MNDEKLISLVKSFFFNSYIKNKEKKVILPLL